MFIYNDRVYKVETINGVKCVTHYTTNHRIMICRKNNTHGLGPLVYSVHKKSVNRNNRIYWTRVGSGIVSEYSSVKESFELCDSKAMHLIERGDVVMDMFGKDDSFEHVQKPKLELYLEKFLSVVNGNTSVEEPVGILHTSQRKRFKIKVNSSLTGNLVKSAKGNYLFKVV